MSIIEHLLALLITLFMAWFAWESTLAVDEKKNYERKKSNNS